MSPTILVIDDEEPYCWWLRHVLRDAGYEAVCALSWADALRCLDGHRVALVLSDMMLPGSNGVEIAARLRERADTAGLPVILMSALPPSADAPAGLPWLIKPFSAGALLSLIRDLLGAGAEPPAP